MGLIAHRRELDRKLLAGEHIDDIELWLNALPLTDDAKSALWLWMWAHVSLPTQRAEAEMHMQQVLTFERPQALAAIPAGD